MQTRLLSKSQFRFILIICSLFTLFGLFLSIYVFDVVLIEKYFEYSNETANTWRKLYRLINAERPEKISKCLISKNRFRCKLRKYTEKRVVACLDLLYRDTFNLNANKNRELHFAFVGDSRIRQQFYNFLEMVPNYDEKYIEPQVIPSAYHRDIDIRSSIIRLRVSFLWRPVINKIVIEEISKWTIYNQTERPCFILLGMAVHHMVPISDGDQYNLFQKRLIELGPILGRLANTSNVIWLNQYPTLDLYGERSRNYHIYSEKINRYNKATRLILENYSKIYIWDSGNSFAEEYIRSCTIFQRKTTVADYANDAFVNCNDYVHTGYFVLSKATQLLYNHICNISV